MNYPSLSSLWDISQPPSQFSHLPDDDFLALLRKQFPNADHSANPQSVQDARHSPLSDDSSPSPPSNADPASRRQSLHGRPNDTEDVPLKRKASSDDMEPGPSSKNQHTADDAKKPLPSRRKSSGNPQDESRLLKRKEQNRAAQRAFRERKEKHVKDLEDKVAALEAKNEATEAENTNLRDLLSRLQQENLALKEAQFTFSVPKPAPMPAPTPNTAVAQPSPFSFFGTPSPFPPQSASSQTSSKSSAFGTDVDWNSLDTFDPSMLSVLDEPSDVPMQTNTPSPFGQYALPQSYKTIANNPLLMSFIDEPPSAPPNTTSSATAGPLDHFTMNFSSPPTSWPSTAQPTSFPQTNGHSDFLHSNHGLDDLFGGNFMGNQGTLDFNALVDSTSMSPITRGNGVKPPASQKSMSTPPSNSTHSSPSTSTSQSPFWTNLSQPGESPPSVCESTPSSANPAVCQSMVLSRSDMAKHIAAEGPSPFTDHHNPSLRKTSDISVGDIISCRGSNFPRTQESPENIEVLKAWRCITQNSYFKDADINELCTEFSKKARCDGTKVVLEPEGVHQLFEKFKKMQQAQSEHPSS